MSNGLGFVMLVTMVTWAGLFGYLLFVDRSLHQLEREDKGTDEL